MTMDDCICPHALNAAGNGEIVSDNMLFENLVLYNVFTGNAIRIGASLETSEVRNWIFRNIDVVQRRASGVGHLLGPFRLGDGAQSCLRESYG